MRESTTAVTRHDVRFLCDLGVRLERLGHDEDARSLLGLACRVNAISREPTRRPEPREEVARG